MSDPLSAARLASATSQLPVFWYFDQQIFELEKRLLFEQGPGYVGHEAMVPNRGDYHTLAWMDHAKMLVRADTQVQLLSNVCRHRQAIMLEGRGNARHIVCPVHRWTYDVEGRLLGAPGFAENPCLHLGKIQLQRWNGLLFSGPRDVAADLADIDGMSEFDFSGYQLDRVVVDEYPVNWKTFLEVYLEDYHVAPFHPGLSHFVECGDLTFRFGEWYAVQQVGLRRKLQRAGTPVYERWHQAVLNYYQGEPPGFGAIWFVYYPGVMIEIYPHTLVVSTVVPRSVSHTTNVIEFYYPEDVCLFEREFVEAEQAAYLETAAEDDVICRRIERGRRALLHQGFSDAGPYQMPLEQGMRHFHEFLRRVVEPHCGRR